MINGDEATILLENNCIVGTVSAFTPGSARYPRTLAWFVREAWPSPVTGTSRTAGVLAHKEQLRVVAEAENLVVFGDGLEADRLLTTWGQEVSIGIAKGCLQLVV